MAKQCERYGCRREAKIKFCSEQCKIAHHNSKRDRTNSVKGVCAACGKPFEGRANKVTCSNTCRQRLFQTRKVKARKMNPGARPRTGVIIELDGAGGVVLEGQKSED